MEQFEDAFVPIIEEAIKKSYEIECGTAVRLTGLKLMIQYLKSEISRIESSAPQEDSRE
jgi:hypothetical protein